MSKVHKRKVVHQAEDKGIFTSIDKDKEALWKDAFRRRYILLGKEEKFHGDVIDWATFDLVVATSHFTDADKKSYLKMLQKFWKMFWPYMANLIQGYNELQAAWEDLVEDQDSVLKNYANQHLELKAYRDFMAEAPKPLQESFEEFHKFRKIEDEAQMEEIRKREG